MTATSYSITGMHCSSCVMNVEETMLDIPGVSDAEASLKRGTVKVEHDGSVTDEQIKAAIVEAGYQPA